MIVYIVAASEEMNGIEEVFVDFEDACAFAMLDAEPGVSGTWIKHDLSCNRGLGPVSESSRTVYWANVCCPNQIFRRFVNEKGTTFSY